MSQNPELTKQEAEDFFSEFGTGWCVNHTGDLSTFDFDGLTRLVFLAHDKCMRVEVTHGGPRAVKICIWKRAGREGQMFARHPTIEAALEIWRKHSPVAA